MPVTEKKYDVVVVGELNVDLILSQMPQLPEAGREIFARRMHLTLGSSAGILAANLSRLGNRVAFLGKIGQDAFGQLVLEHLEDAGVDTQYIIRDPLTPTGASIGLQHQDDRAMVTYAGAMDHLQFAELPLDTLKEARHLHFSAYFFQPRLRDDINLLFAAAQKLGLTTSFDMQSDPTDRWDIPYADVLQHVDLFFPNELELTRIMKTPDIYEAIQRIRSHVAVMAVKRGSEGSITIHGDQTIHHAGYKSPKLVDAIGAGDSFDAGFIHQYLRNGSLEECQNLANMTGAWSTTAPGGTTAFSGLTNTVQYVRNQFRHASASSP